MSTKRRIEITVETEQVTVVRSDPNPTENQVAWCAGCQCHVLLVELRQAAPLADLSVRQLVRMAELNEVHFHEPPDGSLLFCLASLSQWLRGTEPSTRLLPPVVASLEEEE